MCRLVPPPCLAAIDSSLFSAAASVTYRSDSQARQSKSTLDLSFSDRPNANEDAGEDAGDNLML